MKLRKLKLSLKVLVYVWIIVQLLFSSVEGAEGAEGAEGVCSFHPITEPISAQDLKERLVFERYRQELK